MSDPAAQLRSPEEIFDGDKLPDDLKWIITHFGLAKNDPIVVLLAWHWHRVHQNQEVIDGGALQFKAVLDPRIAKIEGYAGIIEKMQPGLSKLADVLGQDEATLKNKLHEGLQKPLDQITKTLEKLVSDLDREWKELNWQRCFACFVAGMAAGAILIQCVLQR